MSRRFVIPIVMVSAIVLAATGASAGSPIPVRATDAVERQPAGSLDYLAWQQIVTGKSIEFAKPMGEPKFRVNAQGTEGASGGIEGDTLAYQQFRVQQNTSDIKLYDLVSRTRTNPEPGVNSARWEYWPDIDGQNLLFARLFLATGKRQVILYDMVADNFTVLAESQGWNRFLQPGQVAGNYVVWHKATWAQGDLVDCEVHIHDIAGDSTNTIPNPNDKCQYAPSVAVNGTAYYGRSGYGCGAARLMKYPMGGPATELVDFPQGRDFGDSYVYPADGSVHVLYDPTPCSKTKNDIYAVIDGL